MPGIHKSVSWLVIISLCFTMNGCYYYKVVKPSTPPAESVNNLQKEGKFLILHLDDKAWKISDIVIDDEFFTGKIDSLIGHDSYTKTKPDKANRYRKKGKLNNTEMLNEVHIYVSGFKEIEEGRISVALNSISKIEIYDKDKGSTTASWIFSGIGIAAGAFGILMVIVALTKSSCPFVYISDGKEFIFTGEIFSGATQPGLERDDYLRLPAIIETEGKFQIRIANEVKEIQSINLAEFIIADHSGTASVLIDKSGLFHSVSYPVPPIVAKTSGGRNVMPLVINKDSLSYLFDGDKSDKSGVEDIVFTFVKPLQMQSGKLVIRAKNSFWLDGLFLKFHSLFGEKYSDFSDKQETASGEKLKKWSLDQKLPLLVYVEQNNKWKLVDYFNIAGPMALRDDILALDLSGISGDTVKIKLECGFRFWELDYAGLDFSTDEAIKTVTVPAGTAIDEKGLDVRALLAKADSSYYRQKEVGNQVLVTFDAPELNGASRDIFLHSRGYYKILREGHGKPDRKNLKSFRKPGRLPEYSRELYNLLPKEQ